MIERVIAMLQRAAVTPEVKQAMIAELQTLPDTGKSVQAQNGALMRACHVVRGYFTPAEAADDFAKWVYHTLEAEYEYRTSEEQLKELAEANEWMFTASGAYEGAA
jgi:hypothetical protein